MPNTTEHEIHPDYTVKILKMPTKYEIDPGHKCYNVVVVCFIFVVVFFSF